MSVFSKIDTKLDVKIISLSIVTGLLTVRWLLKSDFPTVNFPSNKKFNFAEMTEKVKNKSLPKVFWAKGFFPFNIQKMLVISDFDLMEKAFKNPAICDRMATPK